MNNLERNYLRQNARLARAKARLDAGQDAHHYAAQGARIATHRQLQRAITLHDAASAAARHAANVLCFPIGISQPTAAQ